MSKLYAAHKSGNNNAGVDIEHENTGSGGVVMDIVKKSSILDAFACKEQAIKLATDVVVTILSIDQLIMAKQVG